LRIRSKAEETMTLLDQASEVQTREDFAAFVRALVRDLDEHGNDPYKWKNPHLDMYLDALARFTLGQRNVYKRINESLPEPSWGPFACLLLVAHDYD
jgi:hypothetical protein